MNDDVARALVGSWRLRAWTTTIDGAPGARPLGGAADGLLLYGADGWMSAVLMRPGRPAFERAVLALGTAVEKAAAVDGYVSYAGTWRLDGARRVVHRVELSLLPNWIGTDLVREVAWDGPDLVLATPPERTRSGRALVNQLRWRRP